MIFGTCRYCLNHYPCSPYSLETALPNDLHVTQSVLLQCVLTCIYLTLATIIITAASPMENTSYNSWDFFQNLKEPARAYLCIRHSHDHFGAIFGNAARLILLPHHEAVDVLQEDQGHSPLRAQLYEVGSCSSNRSSTLAASLLLKPLF